MQKKNISGITVITSETGSHLENLQGDSMGTEVWLGKDDSPDNYKEVKNTEELNGTK